jgi:peptidoglycan-associated lipoprotein
MNLTVTKAVALGIVCVLVGVLIGYLLWGGSMQKLVNDLAQTRARLEEAKTSLAERQRQIEAMLKQAELQLATLVKDIHFGFDRYDIGPRDAKILDENAKWMKASPNHLILIEGHADERGTDEYNLALGERRAKATMNHLVSLGIQADRMTTVSYGEKQPLCTGKNENCWSKNRRAHFLVKSR